MKTIIKVLLLVTLVDNIVACEKKQVTVKVQKKIARLQEYLDGDTFEYNSQIFFQDEVNRLIKQSGFSAHYNLAKAELVAYLTTRGIAVNNDLGAIRSVSLRHKLVDTDFGLTYKELAECAKILAPLIEELRTFTNKDFNRRQKELGGNDESNV